MPVQYTILTTWIILLAIRNNRLKDQCIRSTSKWIEEGEKPTKYFINRNYVSKQIPIKEDIHEKLKECHCPKLSSKEAMALGIWNTKFPFKKW